MKKLVSKRTLKRKCDTCNKVIKKGEVYYKSREIFETFNGSVVGFDTYMCPRCKHRSEQHFKRYGEFQNKCSHPQEFMETEWSYIPGESVKEPDFDYCKLCGKKF